MKTGRISADEIIDEYFTAIAQGEGYRPDEIPAFIERQKALLAERIAGWPNLTVYLDRKRK